jgi:hypothetical protein
MLAFFESHGTFPVGTAAATPAATCCAAGGVFQCPANPDAWHGIAVWDALGFSIDTAHSFVYSYVNATGDDAQIVAEGDLDCDTLNIDYGLHCHALNGNPTCSVTFPMPCPGQDYE